MLYGKILVVDDDPDIVGLVKQTLETEGYEVLTAGEGDEALEILTKVRPDVVILDIMLPKKDGLTLCQEMRHITNSPILMLSARATDLDRILGLEIGADDYLTKPFNPKELVARIRAMLRRQRVYQPSGNQSAEGEEVLAHQNLKIFAARRRVEVDGKEVKLTPIEFSLLRTLVSHAGMTLTRQQLLDNVWGPDFFGDERTVDAHIRNLRMRLQAVAPHVQFITSVWRVGYKFDLEQMSRFLAACVVYAALATVLTLFAGQTWAAVAVATTVGSTAMVAIMAYLLLGDAREPAAPSQPAAPLRSATTASKTQERLLTAEVVELKRQLELQEQSLANVSHELRTPLTSIIGYSELLMTGAAAQLNDKQRDNLANINRNANVLLSLVNNMLDLSRMSAGQMEMTWTRVHLEEVLEVAVDVIESQIQLKGLELQVDLPDSPLVVQGSFDRLRQVFINLLSNAVKFTEQGSITISARPIEGAVEVRVCDTGIGIAPEQVANVFEKFRQADSSIRRRYGGSGLGLALCASIVKLHNGDISVESAPGKGTTMIVHLPAALALRARG